MNNHVKHYIRPELLIRLYRVFKENNPQRIWLKSHLLEHTAISGGSMNGLLHTLIKMGLIEEVPAEYMNYLNKVKVIRSVRGYKLI